MELLSRIYKRGSKYMSVGIATFFLDLLIMYALIEFAATPHYLAVAIGFLLGISINYYICFHWVYLGTLRRFHHGYFYFVSLALLGAFIITTGTMWLADTLNLPLLVARTIMGATCGTLGFFINSHFNFKLL